MANDLTDAALMRRAAMSIQRQVPVLMQNDSPCRQYAYDLLLDLARQLEARSNSSDHSDGAKEAG